MNQTSFFTNTSSPLFGADLHNEHLYISESDILFSQLAALGELRTFPKDYILVDFDTIPEYCYYVCSGRVMGTELLPSGEELIHSILDPNSLFCDANLFAKQPVPVRFKTTEQTKLLCIDYASLCEAMHHNPQLMMIMMNNISSKFLNAMDEMRNVKNHNAVWRLCQLLLDLAHRYGMNYDNKILIHEKISIQTLTSLLGVNRATTVRSMKLLRDLGHVEYINGYYCIRNLEALRRHQALLENL